MEAVIAVEGCSADIWLCVRAEEFLAFQQLINAFTRGAYPAVELYCLTFSQSKLVCSITTMYAFIDNWLNGVNPTEFFGWHGQKHSDASTAWGWDPLFRNNWHHYIVVIDVWAVFESPLYSWIKMSVCGLRFCDSPTVVEQPLMT